jgi:hypothetical protein
MMKEFDAVLKAGERHRHNYYAWQYARRIHGFLDVSAVPADKRLLAHSWTKDLMAWCKRNPSDISGWSFLLFLMQQPNYNAKDHIANIEEVLAFVEAMHWQKEALWHCLRTDVGCSKSLSSRDRERFIARIRRLVRFLAITPSPNDEEDAAQQKCKSTPQRALNWINDFGVTSEPI